MLSAKISIRDVDGLYQSIVCNNNGDINHTGRLLLQFYKNQEIVNNLISNGSLLYLKETVEDSIKNTNYPEAEIYDTHYIYDLLDNNWYCKVLLKDNNWYSDDILLEYFFEIEKNPNIIINHDKESIHIVPYNAELNLELVNEYIDSIILAYKNELIDGEYSIYADGYAFNGLYETNVYLLLNGYTITDIVTGEEL